MNKCIFCEIVKGNLKSRKIYENQQAIALLDAFPLKEGHVLIISKSHKNKIQQLSSSENNDIFSMLHKIVNTIEKATESTSTLIAIHNGERAGQEIPHVHVHIIPIKESERSTPVHTMFTKVKYSNEDLDRVQQKIIDNLKGNT
jgi:histidine triad (HIT) family protein